MLNADGGRSGSVDQKVNKPELLIPAGSPETFRTAIRYGADAVYIGGEAFSLRAKARNFSVEEIGENVKYAHAAGVKVYVTANIFAHGYDLDDAKRYFEELRDLGENSPDAIIISDPGLIRILKKVWPEAEMHISTQSNNVNAETFLFWHDLGAKRVVGGRELSLKEIAYIRKHIPDDLEIECFIHGAMCISYSGRCLLSNAMTGRDANHGACTHPCRWKYTVMEESRPGEYFPVEETERGTFIFNSKDLCMADHIPELVDAGIDSFKIEGRMKNALYVASVTRTYREAIDDLFESREKYEAKKDHYMEQLRRCTFRPYGTGFYFGKPDNSGQIYDGLTYDSEAIYLGIAQGSGKEITIEQKNKFSVGDRIQIMKPDGKDIEATVTAMWGEDGSPVENCPHACEMIELALSEPAEDGDILRKNK